MAKTANIFIHGDIIGYQANVEDWGGVNLRAVTKAISDAKDSGADTLDVHIHSNGGDVNEGFAIHDALVNSNLAINTIVDGNCFSIATVIFLAGSKRSISKNAELMIHNPWGFAGGTADDIEKYADTVRDAENKILDFYVSKTGADRDSLKAMMDEETFIKPDQAVELKFATDILEPVMAKAKAILNLKEINQNQMSKSILDEIKSGFADIKALFTSMGSSIKNAVVKTESGDELEIDMAGETVAVGDMVTKGGENFTGDATLEDGTVITCEDGKVTAVTTPSADDNKDETVEDLKAQLTAKDEEIATLTASITDIKSEMENITSHLKAMKTNYVAPQKQGTFNKGTPKEETKEETLAETKARIEARKKELQSK